MASLGKDVGQLPCCAHAFVTCCRAWRRALGVWEVQGLAPDGCVEHRFHEVCQALHRQEVSPGKLG